MLQALTDLLNRIFKPVNAFFSGGAGLAPAAQGGDVIDAPTAQAGGHWGYYGVTGAWTWIPDNLFSDVNKLVDRLPLWVEMGAPTPLEKLRVPIATLSKPVGPAQIPLSINEVRKPLSLEEAAWRASA